MGATGACEKGYLRENYLEMSKLSPEGRIG
jgi:hypothetical protein